MRVSVYHDSYGCDTGCCGHTVVVNGDREDFSFAHPPYGSDAEALRAWARAHATDVIAELWPECLPFIDWSTLEVEACYDC